MMLVVTRAPASWHIFAAISKPTRVWQAPVLLRGDGVGHVVPPLAHLGPHRSFCAVRQPGEHIPEGLFCA